MLINSSTRKKPSAIAAILARRRAAAILARKRAEASGSLANPRKTKTATSRKRATVTEANEIGQFAHLEESSGDRETSVHARPENSDGALVRDAKQRAATQAGRSATPRDNAARHDDGQSKAAATAVLTAALARRRAERS